MTGKTPLVLVVDDDPDFVELHRQILEAAGYRTAVAYEPGAAMELVRRERPDLVVVDLMMGSLDAGFTFARELRELTAPERIPVIIVTSVGSRWGYDFAPRTEADLEAMCVDSFLDKPVRPARLLDEVSELISRVGG